MNRISLIVFFSLAFFSCTEKKIEDNLTQSKRNNSDSLAISLSDTITKKKEGQVFKEECVCHKGIGSAEGDKPVFVFNFSNGKRVSVCGYAQENRDVISEFNVFDCATGESFVEFGAVENCRIKAHDDTLKIQLLKFLPVGDDWKWELVQIGIQTITTNLDKLEVSKLEVKYNITQIDNKLQTTFLNSLHKGSTHTDDWENVLGKLEVLSLNGNKRAWEMLKEFDVYINSDSKPDGALAEEWKDALATVKWITKNN